MGVEKSFRRNFETTATHIGLVYHRCTGELNRIIVPDDDIGLIVHYLNLGVGEEIMTAPIDFFYRHKGDIDAFRTEVKRRICRS